MGKNSVVLNCMTDLDELHHLCRLRSTLEAFAVSRWRNSSDKDAVWSRLQKHLDHLRYRAIKGDYIDFNKIDAELHREMVASVGLSALLESWELVVKDLDSWILHVQQVYWPSLMSLYREHVLLLDAWDSADDWVAEEATHQHLEAGWYRLAAAEESFRHVIDPVDRAASFISTHFASHLEVTWIAKNVSFVSASHLTRLFRAKLGVSPHLFLKRVRLERAGELVCSSPDEISAIACRVGYKNASHFVRDFRKYFDVTPLVYRRNREQEDRRVRESGVDE